MLIIGSRALHHYGILNGREASDWDFICTRKEYSDFVDKYSDRITLEETLPDGKQHIRLLSRTGCPLYGHLEFEFAENGNSSELILKESRKSKKQGFFYAHPNTLLMIKESHKYKKNSKFFKKTMDDILLLRSKGYTIEGLEHVLELREKETYTYSHPKLNQGKKDFFNTEGVTYKWDHDSIHKAVARFKEPCYNYFKADKAEVFCSKEKFFELSEEYKLGSVVEESIVLALERCLVPFSFTTHPNKAFLMALEKVCTSITSGWWREYAWENYYQAINLYREKYEGYVDKFIEGLYNGTIIKHEEK